MYIEEGIDGIKETMEGSINIHINLISMIPYAKDILIGMEEAMAYFAMKID